MNFDQIYSSLSFMFIIFYLYFIFYSFQARVWLDMLWEFCFIRKSKLFSNNLIEPFLSFAVVIRPMQLLRLPNKINVAPYLFYRSNDTPPILHSWKNELTCLYDNPKWSKKGMKQKERGYCVTIYSSLPSCSKLSTILAKYSPLSSKLP